MRGRFVAALTIALVLSPLPFVKVAAWKRTGITLEHRTQNTPAGFGAWVSNTDHTYSTTAAQTHTAGNLLVVCATSISSGGSLGSVHNDAGDTFTLAGSIRSSTVGDLQNAGIWYVASTAGATNDTTWALAADGNLIYKVGVTVFEVSGAAASPLDDAGGGPGSGITMSTGTLAVTAAHDFIASCGHDGGEVLAGQSGYTFTPLGATSDTKVAADEYIITTSSSDALMTNAGNGGAAVIAGASFKEASGGGSPTLPAAIISNIPIRCCGLDWWIDQIEKGIGLHAPRRR